MKLFLSHIHFTCVPTSCAYEVAGEERVIIKRWERAEKDIQGGFRILLMNARVPQVLLQSLLVVEGSIASFT